MRPDPVGSYHDADGAPHEVLVRQMRDGWQVLDRDTAAARARVIDTLESPDDGRPQAEAIARDYLTNLEDSQQRAGREPTEAISSTEDVMTTATAARVPDRASTQREGLRCRIRLPLTGACSPAISRPNATGRCSSGCCTSKAPAWSSWQQGSRREGRLHITTRRRADHFLAGGAAGRVGLARGAARARPAARRARGGGVRRPGGAIRTARREAGGKREPASRGSTSTDRASCTSCGRSWPSDRATC